MTEYQSIVLEFTVLWLLSPMKTITSILEGKPCSWIVNANKKNSEEYLYFMYAHH